MSEVSVNIKGPSELKLSITISLEKLVKDLKDAIAEKSDVPADRQRLIYSGRVLKDDDTLSTYKIQSNHTIHMVKGVARTPASTSSAPQPLPTMQAGQNPSDPLTQLNTPMAHGLMAGFNPFAGMGVNTNDPNMMQGMMESPQFMQQISTMMSNPAVIEQLIQADPNLRAMGPQLRTMMESEQFRSMVSNPEAMRGMFQMANQMRAAGIVPGGLGGGMGGGLGGGFGGAGSTPAANPWLSSFAPSAAGTEGAPPATGAGATPASPGTGAAPPFNPFAMNPAMMEQLLGGFGAGGAGAGAGAGAGGAGFGFPAAAATPAAPSQPPEERYQVQLEQLSGMGFTNAQQNVRALLATGGNINGAIEYILGGGGL